ncbi:hypothetical protein B0H16DRAFT_205942 [Mycena metata]|uniref:Uncharacterized protein n=1 Tax=Mycena metata TaxID=1033252 RepID=A0AAD7MSQ1_9AGAR|nr:hypothetical protein B0H16DRAFT_205942 [Mycena metata]
MRLSTLFFSLAALFVAVSATPGFSVNNRGELVSRQDCCEDPPGCGCPDFCSGACARLLPLNSLRAWHD